MPRTTSATSRKKPGTVITTKIDGELEKVLRSVVKKNDTDISKFTRQALREKLASLGFSL